MELGRRFAADFPDYRAEPVDIRELPPELVWIQLKSWATPAGSMDAIDGADALMIYRVVDGKIIEGWGINSRHDRPA